VPRRALHQALAEMVRNAAQAGAPGRVLRVEVGGGRGGGGCSFWVRDNGRGLPEGPPARLFDPFAGRGPGAGLGLFLLRQLVAHWGGALRVASQPGVGTTFTVSVPCP
jgi:signal transduction histidine kinase